MVLDDGALASHLAMEDTMLAKGNSTQRKKTQGNLLLVVYTLCCLFNKSSYWLGHLGHIRGWMLR